MLAPTYMGNSPRMSFISKTLSGRLPNNMEAASAAALETATPLAFSVEMRAAISSVSAINFASESVFSVL